MLFSLSVAHTHTHTHTHVGTVSSRRDLPTRVYARRTNLKAEQFTLQCQAGEKQNESGVKLSMGIYERHGKCNGKPKYQLIRVNEEAPTAPKHQAWLFYAPTGDDVTGIWIVGPEPVTVYPGYERPEFLGWIRSQQLMDATTETPMDATAWFSSSVSG